MSIRVWPDSFAEDISIFSSRKYEDNVLPFDSKPRIARTPVHVRRQSSSDVTVTSESPRDMPLGNRYVGREQSPVSHDKHITSRKDVASQNTAVETEVKKTQNMEIVGHAFDAPEKKANQAMQSTLGSTSGIGSSLEESGELKATLNILSNDRVEKPTLVEDVDDYELDYEDYTDSEDDPIKSYQKHVDRLDHDDTYSDTMDDDGSGGESLEDSDAYEESDEDDGNEI